MNNTNNNNLHPYAAQSYVQTLLVNLISMTFGFLGMIGNTFILYTIGKSRKLQENLCNLLIGVLAFADLLAGIGYFFGNSARLTFQLVQWYNYTTGLCNIITFLMIFGMYSSQIATVFIARDRLIAVRDPVLYSTQNRMKGFTIALSVSVIFPLVTTPLMFVGIDFNSYPSICQSGSTLNKYYITYVNLFAAVVAITVFALYVATSRILTKKLASVKNSGINSELRKQNNAFKTIRLVLFVYAICWCVPNVIAAVVERFTLNPAILGQISPIIAIGTGLNSSLNVVIYAWRHNELGAEMRKVFSSAKWKSKNITTTVQSFAPGNDFRSQRGNMKIVKSIAVPNVVL